MNSFQRYAPGIIVLFFFTSCSVMSVTEDSWISKDEYPIIPEGNAQLVTVRKIWDHALHNAFTDLAYYDNFLYLTFREGKSHNSYNGSIRILRSENGRDWASVALKKFSKVDLRDPKISVSTNNKLYLFSTGRFKNTDGNGHTVRQLFMWTYDKQDKKWSERIPAYKKGTYWLWNIRWLENIAYSLGYSTGSRRWVSVFNKAKNSTTFSKIADKIFANIGGYYGNPGETDFLFLNKNFSVSLLRRNGQKNNTALIGFSRFPFFDWKWRDTNVIIGSPKLFQIPDGRIVAAVRRYKNEQYEGKRRTSLCWLDPVNARLVEFLELPSGNDNGYPGLAWYDKHLWVSYYSSHEGGKAAIYLAKVKIELQKK